MLKSKHKSTPILSSDAVKIREVREAREWDQGRLGMYLGLDRSYVSQLENGRKPIQPWVMSKIKQLEKEPKSTIKITRVPGNPLSFAEYENDSLIALFEHFSAQKEVPHEAAPIYKWIKEELQKELSERLTGSGR